MRHGCASARTARARANVKQLSASYVLLRTLKTRLRCNAKVNVYRYSLYTRYQWWSCSDLTNTVRSRSQARKRGSATQLPRINVAPVRRPLVFRTMEKRHREFKQAVFSLATRSADCTVHDKNYAAAMLRA